MRDDHVRGKAVFDVTWKTTTMKSVVEKDSFRSDPSRQHLLTRSAHPRQW
jgi:hypothetical protein